MNSASASPSQPSYRTVSRVTDDIISAQCRSFHTRMTNTKAPVHVTKSLAVAKKSRGAHYHLKMLFFSKKTSHFAFLRNSNKLTNAILMEISGNTAAWMLILTV